MYTGCISGHAMYEPGDKTISWEIHKLYLIQTYKLILTRNAGVFSVIPWDLTCLAK